MRVALDFDSTVWPLLPALGITYEQVEYWGHLPDMLGGINQMNQAFDQVMPFQQAIKQPPFPGCQEALKRLERQGVEIHVITHREKKYRQDVISYAQYYDLPLHYLDCDPEKDKVAICQERKIPILVDDHPEIVIRAARQGLLAYMLLFNYNSHAQDHGVTGCQDWQELEGHLEQSLGLGPDKG